MSSVAAWLLATAAVSGCSSLGANGTEGDCSGTVRYDGRAYRGLSPARPPRPGRPLGAAELGDCDGSAVADARRVRVHRLPGVDPSDALLVRGGRGEEDYVAVALGLARPDWPSLLRRSTRLPACHTDARFEGTVGWVEVDGLQQGDRAVVEPPYQVVLTADRGRGLELDTWRSVLLEVAVTPSTSVQPPGVADAAGERRPRVRVSTHCEDRSFVADRLEAVR